MLDTEVCDWCGRRFKADDALFDMQADPVTRQGRLVTACGEEHLLALAERAHRGTRRARRRPARPRWRVRRPRIV